MKIFISFSGQRSHEVARILRRWLKSVVQSVNPFVAESMEKGVRWLQEISQELDDTHFGIICLTPENLSAPWIMFEAGAISKSVNEGRVVPLLLDLKAADVRPPLSQFQAVEFNREQVFLMVEAINGKVEVPLSGDDLRYTFDRSWPHLEKEVNEVLTPTKERPIPSVRSERDLLEELLQLTRSLARQSHAPVGIQDSSTGEVFAYLTYPGSYSALMNSVLLRLSESEGGPVSISAASLGAPPDSTNFQHVLSQLKARDY